MNNNFFQMVNQFQQMKNPKQAFMGMLQNSPASQQIQAIQNSSGGRSMEETVRQLAKQQGISEEQLMQAYNSLANRR
jgi:hypothetical protein